MDLNSDATRRRPGRRQFLKAGGVGVAGAAVLAACSSSPSPISASGTTVATSVPPSAPPATPTAEQRAADLVALRTATSLELLIAGFYDDVLGSGAVTSPAATDLLRRFGQNHRAHATTLQAATTAAGGAAYDQPNQYLQKNMIDPVKATLTTEDAVVTLAGQLERASASTCTQYVATLSTPDRRQSVMAVGAASARQAAAVGILAAGGDTTAAAPDALFSLRDSLSAAAAIK